MHDDPMGAFAPWNSLPPWFSLLEPLLEQSLHVNCLLVRKVETAAEYYVREGVLRVAVSALSPSGDFFKCTCD